MASLFESPAGSKASPAVPKAFESPNFRFFMAAAAIRPILHFGIVEVSSWNTDKVPDTFSPLIPSPYFLSQACQSSLVTSHFAPEQLSHSFLYSELLSLRELVQKQNCRLRRSFSLF
jgi:hypothetical protein